MTRFLVFLCLVAAANAQQTWDKNYWNLVNSAELTDALHRTNTNVAKNLVLAIGDATRVYRGQKTPGLIGEEAELSWDKFPHTGLSKTYCTDMTTADSASTATAYHCGVKTKYEMVGVDDTAQRKNCSTETGAKVMSVLDHALASGKSVGIVTTDAVVGASPSGAYAHAAFRNWRADFEQPADVRGKCKDIALQLVEDNPNIQVVLGGGRKYFLPKNKPDPEYREKNGTRLDGRDLIEEWQENQLSLARKAKFVFDRAGFDAATADNTDYLFGMFEPSRVQEETERRKTNKEPSLAEMTQKAIDILSKNEKGFYLFVEGANIDVGHHANRARMALEEGLAFDDAVIQVMTKTSPEDTLVVVSADHSHAFSFGGYTRRGMDILSVANSTYYSNKDNTNNLYTILSYGNGPGFTQVKDRVNLTVDANKNYYDTDRVYQSVFPLDYETHGGEDVPIFASGPMSHLFSGVHEQTFIAHGMKYAACIGTNRDHCKDIPSTATVPTTSWILAASTVLLMIANRMG